MDGIHRRAPKKTSEHQTNKRKQYACTPEHKPNKRSSSSSSSTAYGMENGYTPFLLLLLILLFKMSNIDNKTRASEKKTAAFTRFAHKQVCSCLHYDGNVDGLQCKYVLKNYYQKNGFLRVFVLAVFVFFGCWCSALYVLCGYWIWWNNFSKQYREHTIRTHTDKKEDRLNR